jgi:hypothetical protein
MAASKTEWEVKSLPIAEPMFELTPIASHFAISTSPERLWELADEITRHVEEFNAREWQRQQEGD